MSTASVLIASNAQDGGRRHEDVLAKEFLGPEAKGNLADAVVEDVKTMKKLFEKQSIHVSFSFGESPYCKDDIHHALWTIFEAGHDFCIVYYSGHGGKKTGDMIFSGSAFDSADLGYTSLSWEDITRMWDKRNDKKEHQRLVIIMDSCKSGLWAEKAKGRTDVVVQASCSEGELSYVEDEKGSVFTKWFSLLDHDFTGYPTMMALFMTVFTVATFPVPMSKWVVQALFKLWSSKKKMTPVTNSKAMNWRLHGLRLRFSSSWTPPPSDVGFPHRWGWTF